VAALFVNGSGQNEQSSERTFHRCFLPSFGSFGQTVSEEKNLKNQPIRNKNRLWRLYLLMDRDEISNLNRGPSIDASYHVSYHLAKRFQRKSCFTNRPIRNKNCLWQPCLLMDRDKMSNLYREPSIDASYQVSDHLAKRFQRRSCFRNRPIRNKNCLWQTCLLMDRDKMSNLYREPSIDASYQVSVHLVKWFQRRRLFRNQPIRNNNCLWRPCLLTDWDEMSNLNRGPSIDASYQVSVHLAKRFQRRRILTRGSGEPVSLT
jgi:hypothetical protein